MTVLKTHYGVLRVPSNCNHGRHSLHTTHPWTGGLSFQAAETARRYKRLTERWVPHPLRRCHKLSASASQGVTESNDDKRSPEFGMQYDEPEAAVLLVACAIGLATGAGVVIFNNIIHDIRDFVWPNTPVNNANWVYWARDLPLSERWVTLLLPPASGGLAVGLLRYFSGGFENPPSGQQQQTDQKLPKADGLPVQPSAALAPGQDTDSSAQAPPPPSSSPSQSKAAVFSNSADSSGDNSSNNRTNARVKSNSEASTSSTPTLWSLTPGSASFQGGVLSVTRPLLKAAAAAITLGTGNSLGPEGPSVEIGRAAARGLGTVLKSKQRRLLSLVAAGSGAGVAAGFNAPISGVFFAVETVLQAQGSDLRRNSGDTTPGLTIAMVLLASVLAAIVSQAGLGMVPAVKVPDYQLQSALELPLILIFGACCGLVSASFAYSNQVTAGVFQRLEQRGVSPVLMPAIGGLVTGLLACQYPEVLYQGFGNVNAILQNKDHFAPLLLFQILAVKIFVTSVSKGSGLVGGAYAPSIFMGATLGSGFGGAAALVMNPFHIPVAAPQAYALVGVAAMLAANCQVPLTSVLLLFELTRDYFIILPTLAAVGISYWVASLPAATSAFTPSQFQESDSSSGGPIEDSGYMDALQITSQLGLDVAGEADATDDTELSSAAADLSSNGNKQIMRFGSNGDGPAYQGGPAGEITVLSSMDTSDDSVQNVSVACALEEACVLLTVDTSMSEALQVMDEVKQEVALVTNDAGAVVGVLTRESIVKLLAKGSNRTIQQIED
ncbi:hypothetical protein ABBQ32_009468 [Trebouxia sp. C0010 RCD-2024]